MRSLIPMKLVHEGKERQLKDKELFEVKTSQVPLEF